MQADQAESRRCIALRLDESLAERKRGSGSGPAVTETAPWGRAFGDLQTVVMPDSIKRAPCAAVIGRPVRGAELGGDGAISSDSVACQGMKSIMIARSLCVLVLCAVSWCTKSAHAYPWMIRHGFAECGSCHVDPMGGETLTDMGRVMGETLLSMPWGQAAPTNAAKLLFGLNEPPGVHLGGSFRVLGIADLGTGNQRLFPMQADLMGAATLGRFTLAASIGVSRASDRYEHSSKARLIGDIEDEGVIAVSRTHWLGYRLGGGWMIRGGRLNLPFGIRTPEHTWWVRSETLTDRESDQQHGLSVVYAAGRWRGELMGSLGNFQRPGDAWRERGYSGHLEYLLTPTLALGASSLVLWARREPEVDAGAVVRQAHGLTARYAPVRPLVLLAEADVLARTGSSAGYVGMLTADVEPLQGLHLSATGEVLDRGEPDSGSGFGRGRPQYRGWLTADWFFAPHFELRVDFVMWRSRSDQLLAQLHYYL